MFVGGHKARSAVRAPAHAFGRIAQIDVEAGRIRRLHFHRGVGVHEVEPFVLHAVEQHRIGGGLDRVPSHVRHHVGVQQVHRTADQSDACGMGTVLQTVFEHDLLAHAHAEHRAASADAIIDHTVAVDLLQSFHTCGERTHARHD